ncbi:MAG TPA: MBL fold metallo-hydrolase [Steroidobacteraceae bacterium]|nr:MBL fold metallo-hydrolase [Steroidobacteraceae bacterium]
MPTLVTALKRPMIVLLVALAAWCGSTAVYAEVKPQQFVDVAKIQLRAVKVTDAIYVIQGLGDEAAMRGDAQGHLLADTFSGANVGVLLGSDGVLMVDCKYAPLSGKVDEVLAGIGARRGPPHFLINTHIHNDHLGGNSAFGDPATTVIAQDSVRKGFQAGTQQRELAMRYWPALTFDQSMSLHFNGEEVRLVSYGGGHTAGDTVVYFVRSNVVQMGDLYFNGFLPIVDTVNGGDFLRYRETIRSIYAGLSDDVKIIPGHGPLATRKDLGNYLRMLNETGDRVIEQMRQGKSLAEIKKAGLPEEWRPWSWSNVTPDGLIESIYASAKSGPLSGQLPPQGP